MQSLKVYNLAPQTYEITKFSDHTEINSYGGMNTFVSDPTDEYHLTILSHQPGNAHLQLGFCDNKFQVRSPLSYNVKNYCGTLMFGTGDDIKGHSVALDPVKNLVWQYGMKTNVQEHTLQDGDKFICKYKKNKVIISIKDQVYEINTKSFIKARPCFSLMGNIVVKLCKKAPLMIQDDMKINYERKLKV